MLTQLSYWLIASVLLVATLGYRTYRANRTLTGQLAEERRRAQQMGELHLAIITSPGLRCMPPRWHARSACPTWTWRP